MKLLRMALASLCVGLMTVGYYASQVAYFKGTPGEYAAKMDQPGVRYLALAVFVGAVLCALFREDAD